MKFNIYLTIEGAARTLEAPIENNPVEYSNLAALLNYLSQNLPNNDFIKTVGIRVETVSNEKDELMSKCLDSRLFVSYYLHQLTVRMTKKVEEHLISCKECKELMLALMAGSELAKWELNNGRDDY